MSPALCDVVAVLRMRLGVCTTALPKTSPTQSLQAAGVRAWRAVSWPISLYNPML